MILSLSSLVLTLVLSEAALRQYYDYCLHHFSMQQNFPWLIGWKPRPDIRWTESFPGYGTVDYSTAKYGFRTFGDVNTRRKKILVLGDSYTQADQVSDGHTYYDHLARHNPGIEIFAFGGNGYGTLQEYMILDRYIDEIDPDLILWQFCANDLLNNSHPLESASFNNNNQAFRPYRQGEKIVFSFPRFEGHGWLYNSLASSQITRLLGLDLGFLRSEVPDAMQEGAIEKHLTPDNPLVVEATATTRDHLRQVRSRAGSRPIVGFCDSGDGSAGWSPSALCREAGFRFIPEVANAIETARHTGIQIDSGLEDKHWNVTGHEIAGKVILEFLEHEGLVPAS